METNLEPYVQRKERLGQLALRSYTNHNGVSDGDK